MTSKIKHVLPTMFTQHGCPICNSAEIIEVVTKVTIDGRSGKFIIPNYRYSVCENPKCGLEYVTHKQARHNDEDKLNEN